MAKLHLDVNARNLISLATASYVLGTGYATTRRLAENGTVPSTKMATGALLFDLRDVLVARNSRKKSRRKGPGRPSVDQMLARMTGEPA